MLKSVSLAVAAVLIATPALASPGPQTSAEAELSAVSARLKAHMDDFEARRATIESRVDLSELQRALAVAQLWEAFEPETSELTAEISERASDVAEAALSAESQAELARTAAEAAREALAEVDVDAIVAQAMQEVADSGVIQMAEGMATNGAWASDDPDHAVTYSLMADYAVGTAIDALEEASVEAAREAAEQAVADADD